MDFGEPAPEIIARLYNEIKEKKVSIVSILCSSIDVVLVGLGIGLEKSRKEKSNKETEKR